MTVDILTGLPLKLFIGHIENMNVLVNVVEWVYVVIITI